MLREAPLLLAEFYFIHGIKVWVVSFIIRIGSGFITKLTLAETY